MKTGLSGRFEELDVLRGAAALCVVLSHYSSHSAQDLGGGPFGVHLPTIYGFYAVQLFFMISGFVIYFTLERSATWKDFAFSRVTRLYPAYWADCYSLSSAWAFWKSRRSGLFLSSRRPRGC